MCRLSTPSWLRKNGPRAWNTFLPRNNKSPHSLCWTCPLVWGISFPVSDSVCSSVFCSSVCILWYLANATTVSVSCRERIGYFCCSTKGMCAGQLPCTASSKPSQDQRTPAHPADAWKIIHNTFKPQHLEMVYYANKSWLIHSHFTPHSVLW